MKTLARVKICQFSVFVFACGNQRFGGKHMTVCNKYWDPDVTCLTIVSKSDTDSYVVSDTFYLCIYKPK